MEDGSIEKGYAEKFNSDSVNCCKLLFFMYDKTGEEKYRNAIENVMDWLREHSDKLSPNQISMEELYMVQPFYMEYETRYDKKAKYSDIIRQFEMADECLDNGNEAVDHIGLYLMSLIDALSCMSFEIYEKYRKMQDMFKSALTELLKNYDKENGSYYGKNAGNAEKAMIAYAIIKACRMGIILKEKYASVGVEMLESLMENKIADIFNDVRDVGPFISAYGQYLQFEKESD